MRYATGFVAMLPAAYLYAKAAYGTLGIKDMKMAIAASVMWATAEYIIRVPTNKWLRETPSLALTNREMQAVWIGATMLTSAMV